MIPTLVEPLGDRAFLAHFESEPAAGSWAAAVRRRQWAGVTDVVLAYRAVAVFADPERIDLIHLESDLRTVSSGTEPHQMGRRLVIPVYYAGVDLADVAARLQLSPAEVADLHSSVEYHVFAIGFLPGFPYAGYLPDRLAGVARRESPRLRVPAGSVAIAGRQTAIYPAESPGGWHLLGTTPLRIADPDTGYFPIRAGDRIQFVPITACEFEARRHEQLAQ
jgi:KipI family sensor histidine kinase inhibitor